MNDLVRGFLKNPFWKNKEEQLKEAEFKVLQRFTSTSCYSQFVNLSNNVRIRTLKFDKGFSPNATPLVLIHGFASGLGIWTPCFDALSQLHPFYALDLPGFGRSSRPTFSKDGTEVEFQYVQYIEEWREALGLECMLLLAHGLGGYLSTIYAMQYPDRVHHLILVEPWGFTELPHNLAETDRLRSEDFDELQYENQLPSWLQGMSSVMNFFQSFSIVRSMPTFVGQWLYKSMFAKPQKSSIGSLSEDGELDLSMLAEENYFWNDEESLKYMYFCNTMKPTGEDAFKALNLLLFWAKYPILKRLDHLHDKTPMSFIYGSQTTMDHKIGYEVYHMRPDSIVEVYLVENAGHNVFIDNPRHFVATLKPILANHTGNVEDSPEMPMIACAFAGNDLYWDAAWETMQLSSSDLLYSDNVALSNLINNRTQSSSDLLYSDNVVLSNLISNMTQSSSFCNSFDQIVDQEGFDQIVDHSSVIGDDTGSLIGDDDNGEVHQMDQLGDFFIEDEIVQTCASTADYTVLERDIDQVDDNSIKDGHEENPLEDTYAEARDEIADFEGDMQDTSIEGDKEADQEESDSYVVDEYGKVDKNENKIIGDPEVLNRRFTSVEEEAES